MFRTLALLLLLVTAVPVLAQVQSRPTDPPLVIAANESWYVQREPIQFAGDIYYPAGAVVFFDGNLMARSGHYNGVPVYVDTTVEPFSVVLVPVRRGLMQPYERRRQGDLVGTTGSRTPSFPVQGSTNGTAMAATPQAAASPSQLQQPIGAISGFTSNGSISTPAQPVSSQPVVPPRHDGSIVSLLRPEGNDGLWIQFKGQKWVSAGSAIPLKASEFKMVGEYAGFPVFIRNVQGTIEGDTIYIPTRAGLVAPYKLKQSDF